jgi:hypothetical protein
LFSHLFSTGKAYLTFYKTGMKQILANHKLVNGKNSPLPSASLSAFFRNTDDTTVIKPPARGTRADQVLRFRYQHDMRCLTPFAILLLVCGEMTPFVVLTVPGIVPFTCRIPAQVEQLQKRAEERRAVAYSHWRDSIRAAGDAMEPALDGRPYLAHIGRVLGTIPRFWDRLGMDPPLWFLKRRVTSRVQFLAKDDALLVEAGGVEALDADEVQLACKDRGMNVLGRSESELRGLLNAWLTRCEAGDGVEGRAKKIVKLLGSPQQTI